MNPHAKPGAIDLTEVLSDIDVPSLEVPELDVLSTPKKDADLFAEHKRAAWKEVQTEEARCDFAPNRLRITVRGGVYFISLWKKSVYGRTLTDIKGDDDMVRFFSENITALIRSVLGSFLKASDYAVVTTPRRRHKERNFASMIATEIAANLGLPFYDDCALAHSRHRMNAVFTANNIPKENNVIVFDDFVTSGQTLASMHRVLTEHGKNSIYFVGINNKI